MGDLSTCEQIRAEAIERLAKATHWRNEYMCLPDDPPEDHWEIADEDVRASCRDHAAFLVDALGDFLPTGIEWGVYLDGMGPPNPFHTSSESAARSLLDTQDDHIVRKYTHDWIEVSE